MNNITPEILKIKLEKESFRVLSNKSPSNDEMIKILDDIYNESYPYNVHLIKFDNENIMLNRAIYKEIYQSLEKQKEKYFIYFYKGKDLKVNSKDKKGNLYICCLHPQKSYIYIPLIQYVECQKIINHKNAPIIEDNIIAII